MHTGRQHCTLTTYIGLLGTDKQVENGQPVGSGLAAGNHLLPLRCHLLLLVVHSTHLGWNIRFALFHADRTGVRCCWCGCWSVQEQDGSAKGRHRAAGGPGRGGGSHHQQSYYQTGQHSTVSLSLSNLLIAG